MNGRLKDRRCTHSFVPRSTSRKVWFVISRSLVFTTNNTIAAKSFAAAIVLGSLNASLPITISNSPYSRDVLQNSQNIFVDYLSRRSGEPDVLERRRIGIRPYAGYEMIRTEMGGHIDSQILAVSTGPTFIDRAVSLGFIPIEHTRLTGLQLDVVKLRIPNATSITNALRTFRVAFPGVISDLNTVVTPSARITGWNAVAAIGWPDASSSCGVGLRIGIIDTPVDVTHVALRFQNVVQRSFLPGKRKAVPAPHGTAIASLLVGDSESDSFTGLLPGASLLVGSIFENRTGKQTEGNLFALLRALDWLVRERVDVINMSLETEENVLLSDALTKVAQQGIILTAAAGNGGPEARPAYPAAHPLVLTATAVDQAYRVYYLANHGDYIDFAAPGVGLWTAVPGGGRPQSGTSFAVPFLTAVVARQLAGGVRRDPSDVRRSIVQHVRDLGKPGKDNVFGWGLLRFSPTCSRVERNRTNEGLYDG